MCESVAVLAQGSRAKNLPSEFFLSLQIHASISLYYYSLGSMRSGHCASSTWSKDARAATGAEKQFRQKVEQCRIELPQWVTCKVKDGEYKCWWCRACDKWLHCWPGDANYVGCPTKLQDAIARDDHVTGGVHMNKMRHFSVKN